MKKASLKDVIPKYDICRALFLDYDLRKYLVVQIDVAERVITIHIKTVLKVIVYRASRS